jgi:hypothetical protein
MYVDLSSAKDIEAVEKTFRRFNELSKGAPKEGYDAVMQQYAGRVSDNLSDALNQFAPKRKQFRDNYREFSTPLDAYETSFGAKGVAMEKAVPERVKMMPTDYPSTYFKNRDTINALREQLAGDEAAVRKFANQHSVNQLSGKNASQAQDWLDKNIGWIDEVQGLNDRLKQYVYQLAKSEKEAEKLEKQAGLLGKRAGEVAGKRQVSEAEIASQAAAKRAEMDKALRQLELLDADKVSKASEQLMKYMSDKQLLPPDKLRELKTQIDAVNKTYQDSAQAKSAIQALIRKAGLYSGLGVGGAAGYYGYKSLSD